MRQLVTVQDARICSLTVAPYDEAFPQREEDVERAWDLTLSSFRSIR